MTPEPIETEVRPGDTFHPPLAGLVMPHGGSLTYLPPGGRAARATGLTPGRRLLVAVAKLVRASGPVNGLFPPRQRVPAAGRPPRATDGTPGGGGEEPPPDEGGGDTGVASISGVVWQDDDGDHDISGGDSPLGFCAVTLKDGDGNVVASTPNDEVTSAWSFTGLAPGTYRVECQPPDENWLNMFPILGTAGGTIDGSWAAFNDVVLAGGTDATGYQFGFRSAFG